MDQLHPKSELTESDFLRLFVQHESTLRGYARFMLPDWDLIDEAIQEATVTMWEKRNQLQSADGFVPWAKVILRFKCLQQLDKLRARRPMLSNEIIESIAAKSESLPDDRSSKIDRAMHLCLAQFSSDDQQLLLAPHSNACTVLELAKIRNRTANSLYKLLGRLRAKLSQCIERRLASGGLS